MWSHVAWQVAGGADDPEAQEEAGHAVMRLRISALTALQV